MKQAELEMVEPSAVPRPSTAEEIRHINLRKARDRIRKNKKNQERRLRWNKNLGVDEDLEEEDMAKEEIMHFFSQIDSDGSGLLDREEVQELLLKMGNPVEEEQLDTIMYEIDNDGSGQLDLNEFLSWWKRAGKKKRAALTAVNDKMNQIRDLFNEFDDDKSGGAMNAATAQLRLLLPIAHLRADRTEPGIQHDLSNTLTNCHSKPSCSHRP
eukprot:SAG11_NODE_4311_length_1953_cov_1.192017_2_plen_212_part_00